MDVIALVVPAADRLFTRPGSVGRPIALPPLAPGSVMGMIGLYVDSAGRATGRARRISNMLSERCSSERRGKS